MTLLVPKGLVKALRAEGTVGGAESRKLQPGFERTYFWKNIVEICIIKKFLHHYTWNIWGEPGRCTPRDLTKVIKSQRNWRRG